MWQSNRSVGLDSVRFGIQSIWLWKIVRSCIELGRVWVKSNFELSNTELFSDLNRFEFLIVWLLIIFRSWIASDRPWSCFELSCFRLLGVAFGLGQVEFKLTGFMLIHSFRSSNSIGLTIIRVGSNFRCSDLDRYIFLVVRV